MKATLSLDLDDRWAYLKARGTADWETSPSYFSTFIPHYLESCRQAGVQSTVFIVGRDADMPAQAGLLRSLVEAGHEVGNHSYRHEPWMQFAPKEEIEAEIAQAEEAILRATGERPVGWRGPGFCGSPEMLQILQARGYSYDASTFPTFLGPLARLFYLATAKPSAEQREQLRKLYGSWSDGLRPLHPYQWRMSGGSLLEIPVTTVPLLRSPFHGSYIGYLAQYSTLAARSYLRLALALCRLRGVEPSYLLHPLDFLGAGEAPGLEFFPAMKIPGDKKRALMVWVLRQLAAQFQVQPMGQYARELVAAKSWQDGRSALSIHALTTRPA